MLWHPFFSFTEGEAVEAQAPPSAIWGAVADYFYRSDRRLSKAADEDERAKAEEEARAEVERIAQEARRESEERAQRELEEIRRAVESETLAFGDFYRRLLDEAIARIRAEELAALEARIAQAQAEEARHLAVALEAERASAEAAALEADDEDILILMASL